MTNRSVRLVPKAEARGCLAYWTCATATKELARRVMPMVDSLSAVLFRSRPM